MQPHLIIIAALIPIVGLSSEPELPFDAKRLIQKRDTAFNRINEGLKRELEKLKVKYTKRGDLESANKISDYIKSLGIGSVYLDDLAEKNAKVRTSVGKHGEKWTEDKKGTEKFLFNNKIPEHSLFTHPATDGLASLSYNLVGKYNRFTGVVGITDTVSPYSDLTFRILNGQKLLWESRPITRKSRSQAFDVGIKGIMQLTLEVRSHGSRAEAHAVWIDPKIHK